VAVFLFDSSALVKRYVANEIGSTWVQHVTDPKQPNKIYIAAITGVEVISAMMKKVRTGDLSLSDAVVARAMELPEKHKLRAYDAVQLAAALIISDLSNQQGIPATGTPPLVLVSSDSDLLSAALAEGLVVEDPTRHP
jgi:predicted nucleic acid-binding protein